MDVFLGELGRKLAERWLSLLLLPGLLYLAVAVTAHALGHAHALDLHDLTTHITAWATTPPVTTVGGQIFLVAAVLAGAAGAGLAAQALGSAVERVTLAADWRTWPQPLRHLADRRTRKRRATWLAAHTDYHRLRDEAEQSVRATGTRPNHAPRYAAHRKRTRIALEQPDRPTWSGDRIHAVTVRLDRDLHLDLPTIWPSLWLRLPDQARTELTTARTDITRATTLTGWALLYACLAGWWWPAAPTAIVLALVGWHRTRTATDTYARLLEAATRLYLSSLAEPLGIDPATTPPSALGDAITHRLHTQLPPPTP
jgi:hypothetical protein